MSDIAIRCQGLGKRYRTGSRAPYHRFSELLSGLAGAPVRSLKRRLASRAASSAANSGGGHVAEQWFWALRDIDLEVKQGEVLGVIGRNGAGKSTLLKLLSRVTDPTAGRAEIFGRVGSLLEVGTGFHPELTGRENIFLNGAILGMTRAEVKARFDEIVAFAEVEMFLDTPVKRYSSGMQTRLGFAVAAHLEPEILIVDEVLAVGDAVFQRKCIGKMSDIAGSGRTVLFVSHRLATVMSLCTSAILLDHGRMIEHGPTDQVVATYERASAAVQQVSLAERTDRSGSGRVRVTEMTAAGADDGEGRTGSLAVAAPATFRIALRPDGQGPAGNVKLRFTVRDAQHAAVFTCATRHRGLELTEVGDGDALTCTIDRLPLLPGIYTLDVTVFENERKADEVERAMEIEVNPRDVFGTGRLPDPARQGPVIVMHDWRLEPATDPSLA